MDDKTKIIEQLDARIKLLDLFLEDHGVQDRFNTLIKKEIEFDIYLHYCPVKN